MVHGQFVSVEDDSGEEYRASFSMSSLKTRIAAYCSSIQRFVSMTRIFRCWYNLKLIRKDSKLL